MEFEAGLKLFWWNCCLVFAHTVFFTPCGYKNLYQLHLSVLWRIKFSPDISKSVKRLHLTKYLSNLPTEGGTSAKYWFSHPSPTYCLARNQYFVLNLLENPFSQTFSRLLLVAVTTILASLFTWYQWYKKYCANSNYQAKSAIVHSLNSRDKWNAYTRVIKIHRIVSAFSLDSLFAALLCVHSPRFTG